MAEDQGVRITTLFTAALIDELRIISWKLSPFFLLDYFFSRPLPNRLNISWHEQPEYYLKKSAEEKDYNLSKRISRSLKSTLPFRL